MQIDQATSLEELKRLDASLADKDARDDLVSIILNLPTNSWIDQRISFRQFFDVWRTEVWACFRGFQLFVNRESLLTNYFLNLYLDSAVNICACSITRRLTQLACMPNTHISCFSCDMDDHCFAVIKNCWCWRTEHQRECPQCDAQVNSHESMTTQLKCAGVHIYYRLKVTFHAIGNYYQYFQFIFRLMNNVLWLQWTWKEKAQNMLLGPLKYFKLL
jgi:hypothetical protein